MSLMKIMFLPELITCWLKQSARSYPESANEQVEALSCYHLRNDAMQTIC